MGTATMQTVPTPTFSHSTTPSGLILIATVTVTTTGGTLAMLAFILLEIPRKTGMVVQILMATGSQTPTAIGG